MLNKFTFILLFPFDKLFFAGALFREPCHICCELLIAVAYGKITRIFYKWN